MSDKPLVSVIMGIYNCADTLAESLDSCVGIYGLYEKKKLVVICCVKKY